MKRPLFHGIAVLSCQFLAAFVLVLPVRAEQEEWPTTIPKGSAIILTQTSGCACKERIEQVWDCEWKTTNTKIVIDYSGTSSTASLFLDGQKDPIIGPLGNGAARIDVYSAYELDLNGDGRLDLVLAIDWGGNGLVTTGKLFVLSGPTGPDLWLADDYTDDDEAFAKGPDGKPLYIHTRHASTQTRIDRRTHSFWLIQLFSFGAQGMALDNAAWPGFPYWMQYKYKPDPRQTNLLDEDEKAALLSEEDSTNGFVRRIAIRPASSAPFPAED